ncbi:hypothetical protein SKAU_G00057650 [Synaphobranchus kaupii]|uniref:Uncharacterized protein n=1 Tax=Synaphobranchus kaupii TaxID=118154 RepID=A0A9Q1G5P3_SYNKA|nr:hypothetical protein SKAU_G00057650 [Synaphobranchus kaupii]
MGDSPQPIEVRTSAHRSQIDFVAAFEPSPACTPENVADARRRSFASPRPALTLTLWIDRASRWLSAGGSAGPSMRGRGDRSSPSRHSFPGIRPEGRKNNARVISEERSVRPPAPSAESPDSLQKYPLRRCVPALRRASPPPPPPGARHPISASVTFACSLITPLAERVPGNLRLSTPACRRAPGDPAAFAVTVPGPREVFLPLQRATEMTQVSLRYPSLPPSEDNSY